MQEPTFPGCLVPDRPIGGPDKHDEHGSDFKVVAVPVGDPRYVHVRAPTNAREHWAREIETVFATYKLLEGKEPRLRAGTARRGRAG